MINHGKICSGEIEIMKLFNRILVALDLSTMDKTLIRYSFWFGSSVGVKKIYFIYCDRELRTFKESFLEEDDKMPKDERIRQHLSEVIEKHKREMVLEYEIIIDDTKPLEGLLYWQEVKKTSLLVVGKKKHSSGSGVLSRQFVRLTDCPVLFVPEDSEEKMDNILVPVDFSKNSWHAVQMGFKLQPCFSNPPITCLNVYFAAPHYYGGYESEAYTMLRKKVIAEKIGQFIAPYEKNKKISPLLIADNDFRAVPIINETAKKGKSGLIIIGVIGHSKLKLLTIGSTAEKMMLSPDLCVPLLVIR
jgi:nucleotide-binding universal stress UspA family protein